ncbi:MAG TPA: hypothetical protein PLC98_20080 [Anaerolineales bacterium]|nr:hypothetical protein [Anaerolineales bacterium]
MSISTGGKLVVAFFAVGLGAGVGVTDAAFAANQLPIALLLASGVLLGALNPRLAWVWAAVMGLCLVSARAITDLLQVQATYTGALLPLMILPLVVAIMGVFAGQLLRRFAPEAP